MGMPSRDRARCSCVRLLGWPSSSSSTAQGRVGHRERRRAPGEVAEGRDWRDYEDGRDNLQVSRRRYRAQERAFAWSSLMRRFRAQARVGMARRASDKHDALAMLPPCHPPLMSG
jgi:hypothetical protein